ncbi:hypothetical protein SAMN04487993_104019 [Salipiger marinus]|uniref:Uncharacterized protein n=1 Tax=Salipiger marinus TaxID=555512 RepID=A0A1G8UEQ5_9RHOB|nr:hypothetical protein SAMN04487993_104019 [Salipiger marinus]
MNTPDTSPKAVEPDTSWPREIWATELDEHDPCIRAYPSQIPEHADHRYIDGDIYDSADRYWRERVTALEAENSRLREAISGKMPPLTAGPMITDVKLPLKMGNQGHETLCAPSPRQPNKETRNDHLRAEFEAFDRGASRRKYQPSGDRNEHQQDAAQPVSEREHVAARSAAPSHLCTFRSRRTHSSRPLGRDGVAGTRSEITTCAPTAAFRKAVPRSQRRAVAHLLRHGVALPVAIVIAATVAAVSDPATSLRQHGAQEGGDA